MALSTTTHLAWHRLGQRGVLSTYVDTSILTYSGCFEWSRSVLLNFRVLINNNVQLDSQVHEHRHCIAVHCSIALHPHCSRVMTQLTPRDYITKFEVSSFRVQLSAGV